MAVKVFFALNNNLLFCLSEQPKPLNIKRLAEACGKMKYEEHFEKAIRVICYYNVKRDLLSEPEYHFNNEKFKMGKKLITDGITKITGQVMSQSFDDARETLGKILHTLQVSEE